MVRVGPRVRHAVLGVKRDDTAVETRGGKLLVKAAAKVGRPAPPPAANARKHTIAPGDTLYKISAKYFGNGSKVDAIFEANRAVMQNKNSLPRVGTELKIP